MNNLYVCFEFVFLDQPFNLQKIIVSWPDWATKSLGAWRKYWPHFSHSVDERKFVRKTFHWICLIVGMSVKHANYFWNLYFFSGSWPGKFYHRWSGSSRWEKLKLCRSNSVKKQKKVCSVIYNAHSWCIMYIFSEFYCRFWNWRDYIIFFYSCVKGISLKIDRA